MDHKTFLSSLTPGQRQELLQQSDIKGLKHLGAHWGIMALLMLAVGFKIAFWPLLLLPLGILLISNFMLLHETVHLTPFRSYRLNRVVGRIASFIVGLPYDWFRYFHLAHHRYTNDPDKDPELASAKPETNWQYVHHISGLPIWFAQAKQLSKNAVKGADDTFVPEHRNPEIKSEARLMLLFYVIVLILALTVAPVIWRIWLLPVLIGQPFLRLYLLAEHGRCPPVASMFENTRTTFTTGLVRFLAWNMPFHCEHHAYPAAPFHALPALHRLARRHLVSTSNGYSEFHREYVKALK